jgi:two-component system cell cycle response regulator DivK
VSETGPTVDEAALERLREWGGESLLNQLVELFITTMPQRLGAVKSALTGGELEAGARGAHSLRSTSKNLGAERLSELAAEVERALNKGDRDIEPLVKLLEEEASRVLEVFQDPAETSDTDDAGVLPRVAVVEDNPDNRLLVQALIGDRYDISEYETGQEALDGITADPPDLVLLDISLPGMDGTEVLKHVRALEHLKSLPIIALTAHAMAGDREKYLAMGFNDYVTKPIVDEDVLVGAIERWRTRTS